MNIRTDLAMEAREILPGDPPGVRMREETVGEAHITRVEVFDQAGARALGKPCGTYITIESHKLWRRDGDELPELGGIIGRELASLLPDFPADRTALVVGLGNRHITADALGPRTVEKVLVTRPMSEQQRGGLRPVCAFAPGVLGVTGIETAEVVKGLCRQIEPAVVLVVDALAARRTSRILSTVQIADTGIAPGSGLGSRNAGISRETIGVPVLAIGVPMVVYAATIAWDVMESLLETLKTHTDQPGIADLLGALSAEELEALVREITTQAIGDLVVSPKEIDEAVAQVALAVSMGVNLALHPAIGPEDMLALQA